MNPRENISVSSELGQNSPLEIVSTDGQIILRQLTLQVAKELFDLIDRNRDYLSQFGDDTAAKYPTFESVVKSIAHPSNPQKLRFGIINTEGLLVGSINLTPDRDNSAQAEIGYYLGSEYTGRGYVARSLQTLTQYAFKNLNYDRVYAEVAEGNIPSIKALERASFVQNGQGKQPVDLLFVLNK